MRQKDVIVTGETVVNQWPAFSIRQTGDCGDPGVLHHLADWRMDCGVTLFE